MSVLKSYEINTLAYLGGFASVADSRTATAIALAESGGRTDARNPSSNARGLWQILPSTAREVGADWSKLDDPAYNAHAAHQVYKRQGWGAWSTYNSGAYKRYLTAPANPPTPDVIPGAGSLSDVGAGLHDVARAGAWIANPHNLVRVVEVAIGAGLVLGALLILARPITQPAAQAAASVASKGLL